MPSRQQEGSSLSVGGNFCRENMASVSVEAPHAGGKWGNAPLKEEAVPALGSKPSFSKAWFVLF